MNTDSADVIILGKRFSEHLLGRISVIKTSVIVLPCFYTRAVELVYETSVDHSSRCTFVFHYQNVAFWAKRRYYAKGFLSLKAEIFLKELFHLPE